MALPRKHVTGETRIPLAYDLLRRNQPRKLGWDLLKRWYRHKFALHYPRADADLTVPLAASNPINQQFSPDFLLYQILQLPQMQHRVMVGHSIESRLINNCGIDYGVSKQGNTVPRTNNP